MDILDGILVGAGTLLADRIFGQNETYKKLTKPIDKIAQHIHGLGDTLGEASQTRKYKKMADKWLAEQSTEAQAQNKLEFDSMRDKHGDEMIVIFKIAIGQYLEENADKEYSYDDVVEAVSDTVKDLWMARSSEETVATA